MTTVRIAVVGAGSFVFGPSVIKDVFVTHRLGGVELALMDVAGDMVELMAGVGRRVAKENGVEATITSHTTLDTALPGANFVICAAAPDMKRRFAVDRQIALKHDPAHLITEFGGVAGIAYSLRQIAMIRTLTEAMKKHCPKAWLLDAANPLPRVCQAAHQLGVRTAGFCSVSLLAYGFVSAILDDVSEQYPFAQARSRYDLSVPGTNHLTWITKVVERESGKERHADLVTRIRAGATARQPRIEKLALEIGYLLATGDEHSADFLPPSPLIDSITDSSHGGLDTRAARVALLKAVAEGSASADTLLAKESWERPVDFVIGLTGGKPVKLHALNLANTQRQIASLPPEVFVETSVTVDATGPHPQTSELPQAVLPIARSAAIVTNRIVQAGLEGDRHAVHDAIELDPTIINKPPAHAAIDEAIEAHADLLPAFAGTAPMSRK